MTLNPLLLQLNFTSIDKRISKIGFKKSKYLTCGQSYTQLFYDSENDLAQALSI